MSSSPNSPSLYEVENLALIPSWECDIVCSHCVFNSTPKLKNRLSIDKALKLISELNDKSTLKVVTVSGGEPFLQLDYLKAVGHLCSELGLKFRVVTNASFASDPERAISNLEPLVKIGLDAIGISWDGFHKKYINEQRIINAIRASRKLRIQVQLTCVVTKDQTFYKAINALGNEAYDLKTVQIKCLPVGRADKMIDKQSLLPASDWETGRACRSDFDTVTITHDGTVYPCCAVGGFTKGIALGRFPDDSISTLLDRRDNNFKWLTLSQKGPSYFINYATKEELASSRISADFHDCVNCNRLFSTSLGNELVKRASNDITRKAKYLCKKLQTI